LTILTNEKLGDVKSILYPLMVVATVVRFDVV